MIIAATPQAIATPGQPSMPIRTASSTTIAMSRHTKTAVETALRDRRVRSFRSRVGGDQRPRANPGSSAARRATIPSKASTGSRLGIARLAACAARAGRRDDAAALLDEGLNSRQFRARPADEDLLWAIASVHASLGDERAADAWPVHFDLPTEATSRPSKTSSPWPTDGSRAAARIARGLS